MVVYDVTNQKSYDRVIPVWMKEIDTHCGVPKVTILMYILIFFVNLHVAPTGHVRTLQIPSTHTLGNLDLSLYMYMYLHTISIACGNDHWE